jgi:hypothetical protein
MQTLAVTPRPGDVVGGRYRIDALIGGGGFGTVFRATQLNLARAVAVKLLHPGLFAAEGALERFCREAELVQQLKHPNTVRVYDFGRTETGLPFIVWEHLEGQPLDALVAREGALSPARVVRITSQVLKALMEAHALGIVHRDIKPANLFVSNFSGEPDFVKVLDFGVAKTLSEQGPGITSGAMPIGTPSYMAPEQVRTEPIGPAADLYALGLVMAELLCGRAVVQGRSVVDVFMAQASPEAIALPHEVEAGPLGAVVRRATEKVIAHRYASAREMLADLERVAGVAQSTPAFSGAVPATLPAAGPTPPLPGVPELVTAQRVQRSSSPLPWIVLAGALVVLLGGAAAGAGALLWARDRPEAADTAEIELRRVRLDGIGSETVARRIQPRGWTLHGHPVLNLEGTHQMQIVTIKRGEQYGVVTVFDFVDALAAEQHAQKLQREGLAVAHDRDLILTVELKGDPTEALKLLELITAPA